MSLPLTSNRMSAEDQGTNNVLSIALIVSFVLHFALLHTEPGDFAIQEELALPASIDEIQIPIEFVPGAQSVTTHQFTASELEAAKKLVNEANETKPVANTQLTKSGYYSLNQTKTALHHYLLAIRENIENHKYVPASARHFNLVGNIEIGFSISGEGLFSQVRILESSGDKRLDRTAMAAITRASGKIKRPKSTGYKTLRTSAVIKYQYGL